MPRNPEEAPTPFSRAVAEGLADAIEAAGMSQAAVARKAGLSGNYFNERMRLVKSFTLSDVDKIAAALRLNPLQFLLDISATVPDVVRRRDTSLIDEFPVLTADELAQRDLDLAAHHGTPVADQEAPNDDDARPRP